jgi:ATP-dependent HslUV protease ATP-binding subunit HslU
MSVNPVTTKKESKTTPKTSAKAAAVDKIDPSAFSPKEIVAELDRYIIGQTDAKRAVAVALRNRWRRQQLDEVMRDEILPKNILMIGPTGVGKTEISRRLAKLSQAPFIKVEATKFTEVGYVGRDVESIIRDLFDVAINMTRESMREEVVARAEQEAENRVLDALVGPGASETTRDSFRKKLRAGELDDKEIEIAINEKAGSGMPTFDVPGMPGAQMGMINIGEMLGGSMGPKTKTKKMKVRESYNILIEEEGDKLLDEDKVIATAKEAVENNAIVFLDEIDKIAHRSDNRSGDVSREGVQRDLLPLIEGTAVSTKYGLVKTDHILFIASGAFHFSKPSDMLPELQGRLPIRVELMALAEDDFRRILTEPECSLIKQYKALLATENVTLNFTDEAIDALAHLTVEINANVENIGARRLHTVLERLLEEISFSASDQSGETIEIDADMVHDRLSDLTKDEDLSKFIL